MSTSSQLIQTQSSAPGQSVSVWKEALEGGTASGFVYRKVWQSHQDGAAKAWLSWAHHEHFVLTLLAHGEARNVVQVAGLQVHPYRVEVVTNDAGPDFRRDWLDRITTPNLLARQQDLLKLARGCLRALQSVHALGVMHGDFKADNLCIHARPASTGGPMRLDLASLRLIDFAYAVYRERPLKFVLPTDPERLAYLPDFYRAAIRQAQAHGEPGPIQHAACAQVDLFGLSVLLRELVPDSRTSDWAAWRTWLQSCERTCTEPVGSDQSLALPTTKLLVLTETLLTQLREPPAYWDEAETTLSTWSRLDKKTPVLHSQVTPLLTPLVVIKQTEVPFRSTAAPTHMPSTARPNGWIERRPWHKVLSQLMLAGVFVFIDWKFEQTQIVLTDEGFVLGLLAIAMAPLSLGASMWHAMAPTRRTLLWTLGPTLCLCVIAAYYLVVLFPQGVSAFPLGVLLCLLVLLALV